MRRLFRRILLTVAVLVAASVLAVAALVMSLRPGPQDLRTDQERFLYGSLGYAVGIPYPIFMVLPRVFPDLVAQYAKLGYGPGKPGWGGYGAFGFAWEQGRALPAGFSIDHRMVDRVTLNCALCHTTIWRDRPGGERHIVVGGPGHTADIGAFASFLVAAARDRRFNSARILAEILPNFPLNWAEIKLYKWVLIPATRLALDLAGDQLAWKDTRTAWGPGRDDAFNLPKFVLTQSAWDDTVGNTDFPGLWRMADRDGTPFHAAGEASSLAAVTATSALGAGSVPIGEFRSRNGGIVDFLRTLPAPPFPNSIDPAQQAAGRIIYQRLCSACHEPGGARTNTIIPLQEIGSDPEHVRTWRQRDADRMNRLTSALGMSDAEMRPAQDGYMAKPLVGVWLLAPYLHNGSVPTLDDLLQPAASRPQVFWRGYDVLDPVRVGFDALSPDAQAEGFRFDTRERGNGNSGHAYGSELDPASRLALIAYLKTL